MLAIYGQTWKQTICWFLSIFLCSLIACLYIKVCCEWGKIRNLYIVSCVDTGLSKLFVNILHGLSDMLSKRCVCLYRDINGIRNWKDEDQGAAASVTCACACDVPSTCRWRLLELYFSSSAQHLLCCVRHCYLLGLMFHSWTVLCWRKTLQLFSIRWAILGPYFAVARYCTCFQ